jgi:N-acetylglucosamine kinase-like BadF-type ATPase
MQAIGIDGGGTRTRAVALGADGTVQGWSIGGPGNYQVLGDEGLARLVDGLLTVLPRAPASARSLCLALAGVGRPAECQAVLALARARGWADQVQAVSDARAALEGAHGGAPGLIAIAGTGSIVMGKNASGTTARVGGYGPLLGDQGSGYAVGLGGLRAALQARDGWGPATRLERDLPAALAMGDWDGIIPAVYRGPLGRDRIAALAPVVFAAARDGDAVARDLVRAAGGALGLQVAAAATRLQLGPIAELSATGGLMQQLEHLWPALAAAARPRLPGLTWRRPLLPPVLGAALLARQAAGLAVPPAVAVALAADLPEL